MSKTNSISDVASKVDCLNMTSHYYGITNFIEECETPITIAIQGDWGIGKTSAMEIIQAKLKSSKKNPCIWFKTWQFSVIDNGCNIIFEFMLTFLDKLEEIVRLICTAITLEDLKKKEFRQGYKDRFSKTAQDYVDMANEIIDKKSWAFDELCDVIERLNSTIFFTENARKVDIKVTDSLTNLRKRFVEEYGVPIKENAPKEKNDIKIKKSKFESVVSKIKINKRNLIRLAVDLSAAGLNFAVGALPGYISTPISGGIDFIKDGVHSKLEDSSNKKKNGKNNNESPDNSKTILLTRICNQINYIVDTILDYYEANNEAKDDSASRLCIFIDDLDRLRPSVALDLLEGLKNFAEFERCVFVLAIDKDVINQGLRSKYDEDFIFGIDDSENTNDSKRTRADKFFDKIIQVPFDIPRQKYDIEQYMEILLDRKYGPAKESENLGPVPTKEDYAEFLIGCKIDNPRSIKRYYNLQMLYESIEGQEKSLKENTSDDEKKPDDEKKNTSDCDDNFKRRWYDFCLFVVTVIQIEDVKFYNSFYKQTVELAISYDKMIELLKKEDNNIFAEMLLSSLQKVEDKCKEKVSKDDLANWIRKNFTVSNYSKKMDATQIYLIKFKKIAELINADESNGLDLSAYISKLDDFISGKIVDENFPFFKAEDYSFKMGNGSAPRPYILIDYYGKDVRKIIDNLRSFREYQKPMLDEVNYYIINDSEFKITIYVTPTLEISEELKALFKQLGLLSGSEDKK